MLHQMPYIKDAVENANLTEEQRQIARQAVGRGGKLRSSKPKDGIAAYVWRLIAFQISANPQHHCMPTTADFGIPDSVCENYPGDFNFKRRNAYIKQELDPIVNAVVDQVPKTEWHGVRRWSRALNGVG